MTELERLRMREQELKRHCREAQTQPFLDMVSAELKLIREKLKEAEANE